MTGADAARVLAILGGKSVVRPRGSTPGSQPAGPAWTSIIREGLPSRALELTAGRLGVSVNELSKSLRLPSRTVHRRIEKRERLTPEESERSLRVARALARSQALLGDENGRAWLLEPCRGLGGAVPVTLLDTADGFEAVLDELGRLAHGVIG